MNKFWDIIVKPIFDEIKPNLIVEIGSDTGLNTKNILDYCEKVRNVKLISIDPLPSFDVKSMKEKYGDFFYPIRDFSLNSLKSIENYDIILIDGDHNWFTVFNELKIIENNFNQKNFPIIILHDVSWPYGRRDLYYFPENIPSEYLQDNDKLGMRPNQNELLSVGGINPHLNNATSENTPKNGVLTAIEDFIEQTTLNLNFFKINGFHGLGLIYPKDDNFNNFIKNLVYESDIGEIVEKFYLEKILDNQNILNSKNIEIANLNNKNSEYLYKINLLENTKIQYAQEIERLKTVNEKCLTQQEVFDNIIIQLEKLTELNLLYESQMTSLNENNKFYQNQLSSLKNVNIQLNDYVSILSNINDKNNEIIKSLSDENFKLKNEIKTLKTI